MHTGLVSTLVNIQLTVDPGESGLAFALVVVRGVVGVARGPVAAGLLVLHTEVLLNLTIHAFKPGLAIAEIVLIRS